MARAERIARWMRGRLHAAGARGFVVGLSGGLDSAVVARLAQLAAPNGALGVLLPCHSDPKDEEDAAAVATHLSLPTIHVDLGRPFDALVGAAQQALQCAQAPSRDATPSQPPRSRVPLA